MKPYERGNTLPAFKASGMAYSEPTHNPKSEIKESLNKSFDRLTTNGKVLIPFVVSRELAEWSNHK
jgi:hypothetical protein